MSAPLGSDTDTIQPAPPDVQPPSSGTRDASSATTSGVIVGSVPADHQRLFIHYPDPLQGPKVPYSTWGKHNPRISGWEIKLAAKLMEKSSTTREMAWANAGFGSLRKIRKQIEDHEPWFDPTVIPLPGPHSADNAPAVSLPATGGPGSLHVNPAYFSAADYHRMYLEGTITPTDVVETLLPLIRREDPQPNHGHFFAFALSTEDLARTAASASTFRYKEGRPLGPLDGVPTAVKDEYDIQDYPTYLGSLKEYTGTIQEAGSITSWCVRKLQEAGAIIIGKTSMHEFGLDTSGNNPNYGSPLNPFHSQYYTGGSSSGTAYAVSAGLIPIGLGSDGGGSIRIPSSMCGVFGLKPTSGRVSFLPGQNHSSTCAVLGPIASDVRSLLTVFETIAAPHPSSPFPPFRLTTEPRLRPRLLGVPHNWVQASTPAIQTRFTNFLLDLCRERGYATIHIDMPFLKEGQIAHALTVLTDAATLLPETDGTTAANKILIALGKVATATDFLLAQKLRRLIARHLAWLWKEHPGMLIVTPTTSCEGWPIKDGKKELAKGVSDGDQTIKSMEYVWLANFLGLPSVSAPMGFVGPLKGRRAGQVVEPQDADKLGGLVPIGIMATGEWCSEEALLRWALDCEEIGPNRRVRPPVWEDVVARATTYHAEAEAKEQENRAKVPPAVQTAPASQQQTGNTDDTYLVLN